MLVSLTGYAVDIRHPRVHVPAFADSYLPGVTVSLKAGRSTYKAVEPTASSFGSAALCLRFRRRLTEGVREQRYLPRRKQCERLVG
jgi:hypothetical protein